MSVHNFRTPNRTEPNRMIKSCSFLVCNEFSRKIGNHPVGTHKTVASRSFICSVFGCVCVFVWCFFFVRLVSTFARSFFHLCFETKPQQPHALGWFFGLRVLCESVRLYCWYHNEYLSMWFPLRFQCFPAYVSRWTNDGILYNSNE